MQLAGRDGNKLVWGPPRDVDGAIALLREVVVSGINHIDTADFYGPHVTNQIIRKALSPYPDDLVIVTKVSARRGADGSWIPAFSAEELTVAVHDNLRNLGRDAVQGADATSSLTLLTGGAELCASKVALMANAAGTNKKRRIGTS
jgi:aryl-alcohol dehydrogenase-like predicted oxidoreductase